MPNVITRAVDRMKQSIKDDASKIKRKVGEYTQAAKDLGAFGKAAAGAPVEGWSAVAEKGKQNRAAYRKARQK